jgi:hypothetical protein
MTSSIVDGRHGRERKTKANPGWANPLSSDTDGDLDGVYPIPLGTADDRLTDRIFG